MRSWFFDTRATEGLDDSMAASGAYGGGVDPIDGDSGYRRVGAGSREVPEWTVTKARALSVHQWRTNPMARAILDTYTSFIVGDQGLALQCPVPEVRDVAAAMWEDPRNALDSPDRQELLLRSHMLMGETALETMVGSMSAVVRFSYIDPDNISDVLLDKGNPLWADKLRIRAGIAGTEQKELSVVREDDLTGLRTGEAMFWADWKAVATDRRGTPFLTPILDWLQSYDEVLWNLIDRTALARYMVMDVTVQGDQGAVDQWIDARKGTHMPRSGSLEVHNDKVTLKPVTAEVGAHEDRVTGQSVLTSVAAGAGLAKTWLAEPEDANRATSISMAEPVRRRVGAIQNLWLAHQRDLVRYAVDRAVAARRLPAEVEVRDEEGKRLVRAASTVTVTGPEIAAADAKVNAEIMVSLAAALSAAKSAGLLTQAAGKVAMKKAWEDFCGVPYTPELDAKADAGDSDAIADQLDDLDKQEADRRRTRALLG